MAPRRGLFSRVAIGNALPTMDLLETSNAETRHPWELSRARAVGRIARRYARGSVGKILDWGCGDAFTGRFLLDHLGAENLVGVDPNLTEEQRARFSEGDSRIALIRREEDIPNHAFDLVLCCDVIEHVGDDEGLLSTLRRNFLSTSGRLVVTVPAFQALFSAHDVALKHHRRYSLGALEHVLRNSGFEVLGSGYLFGSLLPIRAAKKLLERRSQEPPTDESIGLGHWRGGPVVTRATEALLATDNALLLSFAALGLKLPGLSVWAACAPSAFDAERPNQR
jgi:SAM-dependent methyltransferase